MTSLTEMAKNEPTERPWKIGKDRGGCYNIVADAPYEYEIASHIDKANAAHIVKCVNAHEKNLAALNRARASLDSMLGNLEEDKAAFGGKRHAIIKMLQDDLADIEIALAAAEGKE